MSAQAQPYRGLLEDRPRSSGPAVVCVANQKGGVGKTTVAVNAGAALAERGHRILLVDLDPQANATTGVGIDHRAEKHSTYDLLRGSLVLEDVARGTGLDNLWCVPGSVDLAGAEVELVTEDEREYRLAQALGPHPAYDVVLIDCPPSLGLLTLNALTTARDLLAPIQCEYYALEGLGQLLRTAERVRQGLNPALRLSGLVLTMYDGRTRLSSQVSDELRAHFGATVYRTVIPRSVRLSEAPSFGEPVITLDRSSRGAIAFRLLAAEIEERFSLGSAGVGRAPTPPRSSVPDPPRRPGPGGRGYGVQTAEPAAAERAWPPPVPWTDEPDRVIDIDENEEAPMGAEWVRD